MRWNKRFNGDRDSLRDKSHKPLSPHPNSHTETELKCINDLHRRNPHISIFEMYGKLRSQKGYSRHPGSLYRVYKTLGFSSKAPSTKKNVRISIMIILLTLVLNGNWMSNMFLTPAM